MQIEVICRSGKYLFIEQPIELKAKLVNYPAVYGSKKIECENVERTAKDNGEGKAKTNSVELFVSLKIPVEP